MYAREAGQVRWYVVDEPLELVGRENEIFPSFYRVSSSGRDGDLNRLRRWGVLPVWRFGLWVLCTKILVLIISNGLCRTNELRGAQPTSYGPRAWGCRWDWRRMCRNHQRELGKVRSVDLRGLVSSLHSSAHHEDLFWQNGSCLPFLDHLTHGTSSVRT